MPRDDLSDLRRLAAKHWWFRGRRALVRRMASDISLVDPLILDAGCGVGWVEEELRDLGTVVSLDLCSTGFSPASDSRLNCVGRVEAVPFSGNTFDLVLAMDVLEHVDEDFLALSELYRLCKPDGYLFVTAPAYPWIWSAHDTALDHRRRYKRDDLSRIVSEAGFRVLHSSYFVTGAFVPAVVYRLARRNLHPSQIGTDLLPMHGPWNTLLSVMLGIEARIAMKIALPFGLTAVVLARKQADLG